MLRLAGAVDMAAATERRADAQQAVFAASAGAKKEPTTSDLSVESWGAGTPAVLVHGSLATGAEEWEAQRPLADEGFRLLVLDRRGYGNSPGADGEDFLADADDIAELMDDGAHLVGHSYGGLGVMFAAARRPEATRSLTLLEPAAFALAPDDAAARVLVEDVRPDVGRRPSRRAVGRPVPHGGRERSGRASPGVPRRRGAARARVPPGPTLLARRPAARGAARRAVPQARRLGRPPRRFEAICDDLATRIGASRAVVAGAGHEIQFTGEPINEALLALWRAAPSPKGLAT